MITMVIIAAIALMLTFSLMRNTAGRSLGQRREGIRWRGIDWSQAQEADKPDDQLRKPQD